MPYTLAISLQVKKVNLPRGVVNTCNMILVECIERTGPLDCVVLSVLWTAVSLETPLPLHVTIYFQLPIFLPDCRDGRCNDLLAILFVITLQFLHLDLSRNQLKISVAILLEDQCYSKHIENI